MRPLLHGGADGGRFVLRWNEEDEWAHLAWAPPIGIPIFVGFVDLESDPDLLSALRDHSIRDRDGTRELWFSSRARLDQAA